MFSYSQDALTSDKHIPQRYEENIAALCLELTMVSADTGDTGDTGPGQPGWPLSDVRGWPSSEAACEGVRDTGRSVRRSSVVSALCRVSSWCVPDHPSDILIVIRISWHPPLIACEGDTWWPWPMWAVAPVTWGQGTTRGAQTMSLLRRDLWFMFWFYTNFKVASQRYFSSIVFKNKTMSRKDFKQNNESALHLLTRDLNLLRTENVKYR